jgi:hypothetical protein
VSPRKSSTSSARSSDPRPRYLGLEVAGEHLPPLSPRWWEGTLRRRSDGVSPGVGFRLIRSDGPRAVVEVEHRQVAAARTLWTAALDGGLRLATVRTWGTLVGAKAWLSEPRPRRPP